MSIDDTTDFQDTADNSASVNRRWKSAQGWVSSGGESMYEIEGGMQGEVTQEDLDKIKERVTMLERENRLLYEQMSDHSASRELVSEEVNKRVVLPLIGATGLLLLIATVGAILNGGYLLGLIMAPAPLLAAWILWRSREI